MKGWGTDVSCGTFAVNAGQGCLNSTYLCVPVPAVASGSASQGSWSVMALSQELQVRGKVLSHGQTVKKL